MMACTLADRVFEEEKRAISLKVPKGQTWGDAGGLHARSLLLLLFLKNSLLPFCLQLQLTVSAALCTVT